MLIYELSSIPLLIYVINSILILVSLYPFFYFIIIYVFLILFL